MQAFPDALSGAAALQAEGSEGGLDRVAARASTSPHALGEHSPALVGPLQVSFINLLIIANK